MLDLNLSCTRDFSELECYGDLEYKLKKIVGNNNFSAQFIKIISHYKILVITLMYCDRLHAWWSSLSFIITRPGRTSDSKMVPT